LNELGKFGYDTAQTDGVMLHTTKAGKIKSA